MGSPAGQELNPDYIALRPGEDPSTYDLDEISRWVGVYSELIATSATLLIAASQVDRWRQRLDYWQRRFRLRRAELA